MAAVRALRALVAATVVLVVGLVPAVAQAQPGFGSLSQLASPNNCIEVTGDASTECPTTAPGLTDSLDVVVSPDGKNVYVASLEDEAITEFARNADGSLTEIGCIADSADTGSTCSNQAATGLVDPEAIAISRDGKSVYVVGRDDEDNGTIAEFARDPTTGALAQLTGANDCIAENADYDDRDESNCGTPDGNGLDFPVAVLVSSDGKNV